MDLPDTAALLTVDLGAAWDPLGPARALQLSYSHIEDVFGANLAGSVLQGGHGMQPLDLLGMTPLEERLRVLDLGRHLGVPNQPHSFLKRMTDQSRSARDGICGHHPCVWVTD